MYCRYCGHIIADDSVYCKRCGRKLAEDEIETIPTETKKDEPDKTFEEVVGESASDEETQKKHSLVANEIVANVKMVGLAILLCICFLFAFGIYHTNDIKPMNENSYLGESCYDDIEYIDADLMPEWERHYAWMMEEEKSRKPAKKLEGSNFIIPSVACLEPVQVNLLLSMDAQTALQYGDRIAQDRKMSEEQVKAIKERAQFEAEQDKEKLRYQVNNQRQVGFKEDLYNHMIWAAVFSLLFTVVGRYIVKLIKWTDKNRTE